MTLPLLFFAVLGTQNVAWGAAPPTSSWKSDPEWSRDSTSASKGDDGQQVSQKEARKEKSRKIAPFAPGSHNLAADIGQVFLLGENGANFSNAIGARLHYTYQVSDMFGLDSSFGYSSHSNGRFGLMSGQAGLRTNLVFFDRVIPYAVIGMGFYRPSYDIPTELGIENVAPILFGLHVGPGITLELTKRLFFGAAVYFQSMFSSRQLLSNNRPVDAGGSFASFYLNIGVAL